MKSFDESYQSILCKIEQRKPQRTRARKAAALTGIACCFLALAIAFPLVSALLKRPDVSYRVMLDINPSIEFSVDRGDKVFEILSYNEDGSKIAADLETGKSVEETVDRAIGRMVDAGYLSEEANSVLLSVVSDDPDTASKKQEQLTSEVVDSLKKQDIEAAVLSQTVSADEEAKLKTASDAYLMSPGRVMLINQILAQNSMRTFEELSALTVNDLNLLRVSYQVHSAKTQTVGTAASMKYLGESAATEIALSDAGLTLSDVSEYTCNLDCVGSVMLYEICFTENRYEYRYRVNAVTGEILLADRHEEGAVLPVQTGDAPLAVVGEDPIIAAALSHAEMQSASLLALTCKRDWVDGMVIYIVSFSDSTYNCKYTYCATNGELVRFYKTEHPVGRALDVTTVGMDTAKATALSANGLVDGSVSKFVCRMERNWIDNIYTYRMEIICAGKIYTVSVNALTGELLDNQNQPIGKDQGTPSQNPDQGTPSQE